MQSAHVQLAQLSSQPAHWHTAWLHVEQVQSSHTQTAHESLQCSQAQVSHSS